MRVFKGRKSKQHRRVLSLMMTLMMLLNMFVYLPNNIAMAAGDPGYRFNDVSLYVGEVNPSNLVDLDNPDLRIDQTASMSILFDWEVDNTTTLVGTETLSYQLPTAFYLGAGDLHGELMATVGGIPKDLGDWDLTVGNNTLTLSFAATVGELSEVYGSVQIQSNLRVDEEKFSVPYSLEVPIAGETTKTYELYFDVAGGNTITKTGSTIGALQNWHITLNTESDSITDPILVDVYDSRLNYVADSLTITELKVFSDGTTTDLGTYTNANYTVATVSNDSANHTLTVDFNSNSSKAYRIDYQTSIDNAQIDYGTSTFTYTNAATFAGENAHKDIVVTRGPIFIKDGVINTAYNATSIDWEIKLNQSLYSLEKAVIVDVIPDGLTLNHGSVSVTKLVGGDVYDAGNYTVDIVETDTTDLVEPDYTTLTLDFSNADVTEALVISYTTDIEDEKKDNQNNIINFGNNATLTYGDTGQYSASAASTKYIKKGQPINKKGSRSISYEAAKYINWEVDFNLSEIDMGTKEVTDTFEEGQFMYTLDVGSNQVRVGTFKVIALNVNEGSENNGNDSSGNESDFDARLTEVSTLTEDTDYTVVLSPLGFTLTFTNDITQAYRVQYVTQISDYDDRGLNNTAGIGSYTDSESVDPDIRNEYSKTNTNINYGNNILSWNISIKPEEHGLTNLVVSDDFSEDQYMTADQYTNISVTASNGAVVDFIKTDNTVSGLIKGFSLTFNSEVNYGDYTITYNTTIDPDVMSANGDLDYRNDAVLTFDEGTDISLAKTPNMNGKADRNGQKTGTLRQTDKEIDWIVDTNYLSKNLAGVEITDSIEGHQRLVLGSTKIQSYTVDAGGTITNLTDLTALETAEFTITEDRANNTLHVVFPINITTPYRIVYTTEFEGISQTSYTNTAVTNYGESYTGTVAHTDGDKFVSKGGSLVGVTHVNWSVTINESQSTIADITLNDTVGAGLILVVDDADLNATFTLLDNTGNPLKDATDNDLTFEDFFTYTEDARTLTTDPLTFHLASKIEINEEMILTYRTDVNADEVLGNEIKNTISFEGNQVDSGVREGSKTISTTFFTGSATGHGEVGIFTMTKQDKDDPTIKLQGVEFEFYKEDNLLGNLTTDASGEITVENLRYATYKLKEINVPEGYKVDNPVTTFTVNSTTVKNIVVVNERVRSIRIKKVDKSNVDRVLSGAEFEIYNDLDELIATVTTDNNGYAVKEVDLGNYTVKEVKAPSRYYLDSTAQAVSVDNSAISFELTFENTRIPYTPSPDPDPEPEPKPVPDPEVEPVIDLEPVPEPEPEEKPEKKIEEKTTTDTPKEGSVEIPEDSKPKIDEEPENGTVEVDDSGKWTYTPDPGFEGDDSFTIKVENPDGSEEIIYFEFEVEENPLGFVKLPQTGDSDSHMRYVFGGLLMLLGIVLFKSKK